MSPSLSLSSFSSFAAGRYRKPNRAAHELDNY